VRARPPTRRRKRRPTAPGGAIPRAARDRHALDASRATNVRTSVAVIQLVANGRDPSRDDLAGEDFSPLACRLYFSQQAPLYLLPDGTPGAGAPGALLRPVYFLPLWAGPGGGGGTPPPPPPPPAGGGGG